MHAVVSKRRHDGTEEVILWNLPSSAGTAHSVSCCGCEIFGQPNEVGPCCVVKTITLEKPGGYAVGALLLEDVTEMLCSGMRMSV